jgi:hypothetical protein
MATIRTPASWMLPSRTCRAIPRRAIDVRAPNTRPVGPDSVTSASRTKVVSSAMAPEPLSRMRRPGVPFTSACTMIRSLRSSNGMTTGAETGFVAALDTALNRPASSAIATGATISILRSDVSGQDSTLSGPGCLVVTARTRDGQAQAVGPKSNWPLTLKRRACCTHKGRS